MGTSPWSLEDRLPDPHLCCTACTHSHTHTHTCLHTFTHTLMHILTHSHSYTHAHTHSINTYTHACTHSHTHAQTHTLLLVHTYTRTHSHSYTHVHAHTLSLMSKCTCLHMQPFTHACTCSHMLSPTPLRSQLTFIYFYKGSDPHWSPQCSVCPSGLRGHGTNPCPGRLGTFPRWLLLLRCPEDFLLPEEQPLRKGKLTLTSTRGH